MKVVHVHDQHDYSNNLFEFVANKAARGVSAAAITEEANIAFNQGVLPGVPESEDGFRRRRYTQSMIDQLLRTAGVQEDIERIRKERDADVAELAKAKRDEQLARARLAKQQKHEQELIPDLYERFLALEEAVRKLGLLNGSR